MTYVRKTTRPWRKLREEIRRGRVWRWCNDCDELKPLEREFWRHAYGPRGRDRKCKRCRYRYVRTYDARTGYRYR